MKGTPGVWAKLSKDANGVVTDWQPLLAHCADVAAVLEALLENTILGKRLAYILGVQKLERIHIARLCVLAALHDAGKANLGFLSRGFPNATLWAGHVTPIIALFASNSSESTHLINTLNVEEFLEWFESTEQAVDFLLTAWGHHGQPIKPHSVKSQHQSQLWHSWDGYHPISDGVSMIKEATKEWFPEAYEKTDYFPEDDKIQHFFNGILIPADWIASDEKIFPFATSMNDRMPFARDRASSALKWLGLDVSSARISLPDKRPGFERVAPFTPHPIQQEITDLTNYINGSLTLLESETGSGKTEAMLSRLLQLYYAGLVDGLYIAVPTRSAASQLHRRVKKAIERMFPNPNTRPAVIMALPRYLVVDDAQGHRISSFEVVWDDDPHGIYREHRWAAESSKRYLAAPIAVGTIDQVLLSTLQVKHAHIRAAMLSRQLLVVDEVHASDTYMTRLLDEVLSYHLNCGGHAFLMSATLGSTAQSRLLNINDPSPSPFNKAKSRPYPAIYHCDGQRQNGNLISCQRTGNSKSIDMRTVPANTKPYKAAEIALDAAREGARVLMIRNTVRDCIATQNALEEKAESTGEKHLLFKVGDIPVCHHSRYAPADRQMLDAAVEEVFKPRCRQSSGVVLVATQTVEQSLDIDADFLITDLCPIDVLLQRLGRLFRMDDTTRPAEYSKPQAVVLTPECDLSYFIRREGTAKGPAGIGTVYEDLCILEATRQLLGQYNTWNIPDMNRTLVEGGTHPEILDKIAYSKSDAWKQHRSHMQSAQNIDRMKANAVLLPRDQKFSAQNFPDDLSEVKTRLGEGDRCVELTRTVRGPFSTDINEMVIPSRWLPEDGEEAEVTNVIYKQTHFYFDLGEQTFLYDRLGLRPI